MTTERTAQRPFIRPHSLYMFTGLIREKAGSTAVTAQFHLLFGYPHTKDLKPHSELDLTEVSPSLVQYT